MDWSRSLLPLVRIDVDDAEWPVIRDELDAGSRYGDEELPARSLAQEEASEEKNQWTGAGPPASFGSGGDVAVWPAPRDKFNPGTKHGDKELPTQSLLPES